MSTASYALGVDFGTSITVAVARTPDGRTRTLLVDGSPLLPSAVYADLSSALLVGRDAEFSARLEPARFEPNPKRRIDDGAVLLGEREVTVVDLIAAVLRRVREEWTRVVGGAEPELTLTHPAAWGAPRRAVLTAAAGVAGFDQVRLIAEPVAAAAYLLHVLGHHLPVGSVVVVHDLGAGTLDVSAVRRTPEGFEILAVAGRDDLGGADLDAAVIAHLGQSLRVRCPSVWDRLTEPVTVEDRRMRRMFWDDVRAAKERLSRAASVEIVVPLAGIDLHLTRAEFESLATPMLIEAVALTSALVTRLEVAEDRIVGVFLVGGSSRIPLLSTLLFQAFGRPPIAIEQPELVVGEGSILTGEGPPTRAVRQSRAEPARSSPARSRSTRPGGWRRWLLRFASAAVLPVLPVLAGTLVVAAAVIGLLVYSVSTRQGWLPDWTFLPKWR